MQGNGAVRYGIPRGRDAEEDPVELRLETRDIQALKTTVEATGLAMMAF